LASEEYRGGMKYEEKEKILFLKEFINSSLHYGAHSILYTLGVDIQSEWKRY
jgi:hypothetical protein